MSATISITVGSPNHVSVPTPQPTRLDVSSPGAPGPTYSLPITNLNELQVTQYEHRIPKPTSVILTDAQGRLMLIDTRIDPLTYTVSFRANRPLTGFIYIS